MYIKFDFLRLHKNVRFCYTFVTMLMFYNKNKEVYMQSGRSMIEMLGVLAIIGVLSVGGIVGYSKAMQKNRLNNTRNQISRHPGT